MMMLCWLIVLFTSNSQAKVYVTNIASIGNGEIVRTIDKVRGLVCFSIRGSSSEGGAAVSCVRREVVNGIVAKKVGDIKNGQIVKIYDSVFKIDCSATRGSSSGGGAGISCI